LINIQTYHYNTSSWN